MSTQPGASRPSGGGGAAAGVGMAALMGAGLIVLAIVIGIVLLQVVDDGDVDANSVKASPSKSSTTTTKPKSSSSSSSVPTTPAKSPSELHYLVLNGGAPTHAASDMTDALRQKGYTNNAQANDWSGHSQTGNTVMCQDGLEREATALATAVGEGAVTAKWPTPAPPFSDGVDCVVVVGK